MRKFVLIAVLIIPGILGVIIFTAYAITDYMALIVAYRHFEQLSQSTHEMSALFVAEAMQNVYRLNLFAEGVWALLSAILAGIGIHGMCVQQQGQFPA